MNELIQGLRSQIEALEDGGLINLVETIENEGMEATNELLSELYEGIKNKKIRISETVNDIPVSILVFAK
ncbi:MAG: hypothetical protein LIR50_05575 [Bacillota bacterium]|nr:hypothetical protein [Bacillota bacterium]